LDGAITPSELSAALRSYTGNRLYQLSLRAGAPRIDLDGNMAGSVTAEQAAAAWAWLRHYEAKAARRKAEIAQAKAVEAEALKPKRLGLADLKAAAIARKQLP
jgi:ProP effector